MMASPTRKPQPEAAAKARAPSRAAVRPVPPWEGRGQERWAPRPMAPLMHGVLQRKCACGAPKPGGGACASCADEKKFDLQRKLAIGSSNDPLEHEADRIAEQVLSAQAPAGVAQAPLRIQRVAAPAAGRSEAVPASVDRVLGGSGRALDTATRQDMEQRFGNDFSAVRIHDGTAAAQSARDLRARAYTVGRDIVFGAGRFAPATSAGRRLLAHELVHVVQQAPGRGPLQRNSDDDEKLSPAGKALAKKLKDLIAGAEWKEIRKRVYPRESAAGIKRAEKRRAGKLPDMTGLGSLKSLDQFAVGIRALQTNWTKFSGADARVAEIDKITGAQLRAAKVPEFEMVIKQKMEFKGAFNASYWAFIVSQDLVSESTLHDEDAAELANTALHESRHAEQHFLAARYAAGVLKQDAATIQTTQELPETVAEAAVAEPIDSKTDKQTAALGTSMFEAMVTKGTENQKISDDDRIKEMGEDRVRAQKALSDLLAAETTTTLAAATKEYDTLKAQVAEVEHRYTLYRNIPYEADAHEVGDAAELAFKKSK
jgi:Domain of unknown function (DUF4157)